MKWVLFMSWLFKFWIVLSTRVKIYLKVNTVLVSPILIQGMVIHLVESAIARLNNQDQALVVQQLNSAINQINCYPELEDKYYENQSLLRSPLDSSLSSG